MRDSFEGLLQQQTRVQTIVWMAFVSSVFIYGLFAWMICSKPLPPTSPEKAESPEKAAAAANHTRILRLVLGAVAAATAVGATVYRRRTSSDAWLRQKLERPVDLAKLAGLGTRSGPSSELAKRKMAMYERLDPDERKLAGLLHAALARSVIILAVQEVPVILGLVLAVLTHEFREVLPFAAVTLVLSVSVFPAPRALVERARSQLGPAG